MKRKHKKLYGMLLLGVSLMISSAVWVVNRWATIRLNQSVTGDSVVELLSPSGEGGTGFEILSPSGRKYTLTNRHICDAGATLAQLPGRSLPLRVIEIYRDADLCLLAGIKDIPAAELADAEPAPGEPVSIYGFGELLPLTKTVGEYVGSMNNLMVLLMFGFQSGYVTATILPGNSGSPVFNSSDKVIGVAFASGDSIAWRALIVQWIDIKKFLEPY